MAGDVGRAVGLWWATSAGLGLENGRRDIKVYEMEIGEFQSL